MSAESFLDAVDARAAAATPEPWQVLAVRGYPQRVTNGAAILIAETYIDPKHPALDAQFIAAARTDLPRLSAFARVVLERLDGLIGSTARNGHQPAGWTTDYFEGYVRARQEINETLRDIRAAAAEHLT